MTDDLSIREIQEIADQYKKELGGYLSPSLIADAFLRDEIITVRRGSKIIGFLIHGSMKDSEMVIRYTASHKDYVQQNIGTLLVERLIQKAREANVAFLIAKVREDLPANTFWQKMGFAFTHSNPSNNRRGRLLRSYRLSLRNLLGEESPRFNPYLSAALDANQIITLLENRSGRDVIEKLFKAFFENKIRLMISDELQSEAQRAESGGSPLFTFLRTLEVVKSGKDAKYESDVVKLMGILFPDSTPSHRKYNQNLSDCRHLVTCAWEKITYFVTQDKALLLKGGNALNKIGLNLQIVSPEIPIKVLDLRETSGFKEAPFIPHSSWRYLRLGKIDNRLIPQVVDSFDHNLRQSLSSGIEYSNRADPRWKNQLLYLREIAICGLVIHNDTHNLRLNVYPVILSSELYSQPFLMYLLQSMVFAAIGDAVEKIDVYVAEQLRDMIEPVLNFMGFLQTKEGSSIMWSKFLLKEIVTPSNFQLLASQKMIPSLLEHERLFCHCVLAGDADVTLPDNGNTAVTVLRLKGDDKHAGYSLSDIEHIYFPLLFKLRGRNALLIPIKSLFANELIPARQNPTLFEPECEKLLRFDNVYFSGSNALGMAKPGTPIVFYCSAPEKKAIATAKVIEAIIDNPEIVARKYQNLGAFNTKEIETVARRNTGMVMAIRFHWTLAFKHPVSSDHLKQIYNKKGHNFVAPQGPARMPFDVYLEILKTIGVIKSA